MASDLFRLDFLVIQIDGIIMPPPGCKCCIGMVAAIPDLESWLPLISVIVLGAVFTLRPKGYQGQSPWLDSGRAKDAAIRSLAASALNDDEHKLFERLQRYIKTQQKTRDKLGHWIIGSSDTIPGAMIIIDPMTLWASTADFKHALREALKTKRPPWTISDTTRRDEVYVYRINDIDADAKCFASLADLVGQFTRLCSLRKDDPQRLSVFDELSRDARLRTR
jgi:hypothetical protein